MKNWFSNGISGGKGFSQRWGNRGDLGCFRPGAPRVRGAVLLLGLSVGLLAGCAIGYNGQPMTPRTLAKGNFSGIHTPGQEVFRDEAAWDRFWSEHQGERHPVEVTPAVDFGREMVIAVTMGRQRTGGYSIEVVRVEEVQGGVRVSVTRTLPPPDAMVIQALSAPYHFVAVPARLLPVRFAESTEPAPGVE